MSTDKIGEDLVKHVSCKVEWKPEVLDGYSADASPYRMRPQAVVFPRNHLDVASIVKFAACNGIGVTPRGGGTGLVGGGIGDGIVISLMGVKGIALGDDYVTVGAGVTKGELDRHLEGTGKFFSPNPSVGPYCTIGGMLATNASGTRALKYGSMIDNVMEVEFVDGRGCLHKFPDDSQIASNILDIACGMNREDFPKVAKNSCGYRLDAVSSIRDAHKILAGSEGTLGIIVSTKLKVHNIPQRRVLSVYGYTSAYDAAHDCIRMISMMPAAVEFLGREIAQSIPAIPEWVRGLIYMETDKNTETTPAPQGTLRGKLIRRTDNTSEMDVWWKYRHSSLLQTLRKRRVSLHLFEDATVPVENIERLMRLLEDIEECFHVSTIMYGHIGSGNPHVILYPAIHDVATIRNIAEAYFAGVIGMGGTITGEHGDGLARTDFVRMQYGDNTLSKFQKLKKLLDPQGILNPGKIISHKRQLGRSLVLE